MGWDGMGWDGMNDCDNVNDGDDRDYIISLLACCKIDSV